MVHCYSTGDGNVSFHKGTLAPPGEYDWTCASFGPLESTTDTANGLVQSFLHSLWQKVPIIYNGRPLSTSIVPSHLDRPRNTWCFRPIRVHNPNGTSIWFSRLCTDDRGETLYLYFTVVCLFSVKIAPSYVGIWTSLNTWFIGPTRVQNANGNLIVSVVFAGLTDWQSDRKTDRPGYSVRCGVIMRNYVGYGKAAIVWL